MIYLLEDEESIRELVLYTLRNSGLDARGFATAGDFWQGMAERKPRLALLDIMLPDEDGLAVLKKLRGSADTAALPVIMLTAKGSEHDKVLGLDLGADDYLPKPFGMMELVARVKRLLKRTGQQEAEYTLGALQVSVAQHMVWAEGQEVLLTIKEFELLCYLLQNSGMALTRDKILAAVWGYDFDCETRTVDVHIRTLRSKLGNCGEYIQTVRGLGYKIGGAL